MSANVATDPAKSCLRGLWCVRVHRADDPISSQRVSRTETESSPHSLTSISAEPASCRWPSGLLCSLTLQLIENWLITMNGRYCTYIFLSL